MFVLQFILIELTGRFKFINLVKEHCILTLQILILIDENILEDFKAPLFLIALKFLVLWRLRAYS